ncbi:MAG: hypothetical protein MR354_00500 [Bacteroides xylanisolvens]|nr:hypothetical protein [Bacteroides xylanisolvens]
MVQTQNTTAKDYKIFTDDFKVLAAKHKSLVTTTLSNIFTMRIIGNKTHGDLAEVGITEFIRQFMYNYDCEHVGKANFRTKGHEEDILIKNELTKKEIPVSLKAYGDGPLQLSTDKDVKMFPLLSKYGNDITDPQKIKSILNSDAFAMINTINVMPLIYREEEHDCNIMVFNFDRMRNETKRIVRINKGKKFDYVAQKIVSAKGRKHPIYLFLNNNGEYICEVRYGGKSANALQRGLWTQTINAFSYFDSLTNGWITYNDNMTLVQLIRLALNSPEKGHENANTILQNEIKEHFINSGK